MCSANEALRKLRINQRKCLFNDESIEQLPVYSYNACILVCRAQAALRLCNCRPYYYPFMNGSSCSPSGLLCLAANKWPQSAGVCVCAKTCVEIVYTQNSLKKINWWGFVLDISEKVFAKICWHFRAVDGGIPFAQKSSFRYEILAPRMRLRRDVLFSYDDLLVSFGGVAALFLGCNFLGMSRMCLYLIKTSVKFFIDRFHMLSTWVVYIKAINYSHEWTKHIEKGTQNCSLVNVKFFLFLNWTSLQLHCITNQTFAGILRVQQMIFGGT